MIVLIIVNAFFALVNLYFGLKKDDKWNMWVSGLCTATAVTLAVALSKFN